MTPENFSAFLKSPKEQSLSIDHLQKLIEKYPYAQSLRIAFLKKLKTENHPDFEKYLTETATYAYDRNFLRKYVNGEQIYILEYANNQLIAEELETLDLIPLKSIDENKVILEELPKNSNETVIEEMFFEEEVPIIEDNKDFAITETKVNSELIEIDFSEEEETKIVQEEINNDELSTTLDETESSTEKELVSAPIEIDFSEKENLEDSEEDSIVEAIEPKEKDNEISEVDKIEIPENLLKSTEEFDTNNENTEEMQEAVIEKESLDSEIQQLIADSKKVEIHAPIEEDIDQLIGENELEGLDDEIEFGFEIDQKIIADNEDITIFESEAILKKHGNKKTHHNEFEFDERENSVEDFELSPDNVFSKDDLRQEGDLFFLDDRPTAEELAEAEEIQNSINTPAFNFVKKDSNYENEDAEAFPEEFEEGEATEESRENVEKIKAVLSKSEDSKADKKAKIKAYLKRIAQIPLEEESIISETYADLLAKQGKIERSIRMYQQLILKNPQKKVYFAAKIKQLIKSI